MLRREALAEIAGGIGSRTPIERRHPHQWLHRRRPPQCLGRGATASVYWRLKIEQKTPGPSRERHTHQQSTRAAMADFPQEVRVLKNARQAQHAVDELRIWSEQHRRAELPSARPSRPQPTT